MFTICTNVPFTSLPADLVHLMKGIWGSAKPKYFKTVDDFRNIGHPSPLTYLLFDTTTCEAPFQFLKQVDACFDLTHKWILLFDNKTFIRFASEAATYQMGVDTDVLVVIFHEEEATIGRPYKIKRKHSQVLWEENWGTWNVESGLSDAERHDSKADKRRNFNGTNLTMAIHLQDPDTINHLQDLKYPRVDTPTKQDYEVAECLMRFLNASFTIITENSHGYKNETTGEWDGIIKDLIDERAEIDGGGMFITYDRLEVVDCISYANKGKIKFVLRKPPLAYVTNVIAVAFRSTVWISMLAVSVFFAIALYLILNWETKRKHINFKESYTTSDIVLILFEAVCQQGTTTEPRSVPGRAIMLILFSAFMFLFVSYSANVVVLLQSTGDISDLNALLKSRMKAGAANVSYMVYYLYNLKEPLHRELYDKKIGPGGFYSPETGLEMVQKGFFAFQTVLAPAYDYIRSTFTDYEICSLQELEGFMENMKAYYFIKKRSHLKEIARFGMLKIGEYGLHQRSNIRYERKPKCYSSTGSFGSVGILEIYQAFLILAYGIVASGVMLAVEKITAKQMKRRKMRDANSKAQQQPK